ncbi:MAG TPA: cytochrome P460 family protein [Bryobacteraceae bacterium]|nr:cytochrome P460 family protein [Bryobacteraceae bacterium]
MLLRLYAAIVPTSLAGMLVIAGAQGPGAPATDRVGFPKDYQTTFQRLRAADDAESKTTRIVYGNRAAASKTDSAYPYGSIIVMETWTALKDDHQNVLRDDAGHFRKDKVTGLHVMRKERGFGAAYAQNRAGEWEYVEYRPDGTYITAPAASAKCAACHLKAGARKDFVYGGSPGAKP